MRSICIAEWILALVTTRDRAASTAGDLAEERMTRGAVWFWSGVLRTAASQVWRAIAETPTRVTGLAFLAAVVGVTVDFLFAGLSGVAFFFAALWGGHPAQWIPSLSKIWFAAPALITSLLIGRMLARWAADREVAACLVYLILAPALGLLIDPPQGIGLVAVIWVFVGDAALRTPALAGAVWGRRRRLRTL